jgi:hypothetical protein
VPWSRALRQGAVVHPFGARFSDVPCDHRVRTLTMATNAGVDRGGEMDLMLAGVGRGGNEAFLGIGVIGWIVIILIVAAVVYFVSRRGRTRGGV